MNSLRISTLAEAAQPSVSSCSSSIWRTECTGSPTSSTRSAPTASPDKPLPPVPRRIVRSASTQRDLLVDDGRPLNFSRNELVPQSNSCTRTPPGKRDSHTDNTNRRSASCSAASRKSMQSTDIQRWAGLTRSVGDWDGLRRDPELWLEAGDCYVHLHGRGGSRRGPSFCVPFRVLRQKKCNAMLSQCDAQMTLTTGTRSQQLRRMPSSLAKSKLGLSTVQLFIPAPEGTSREASFKWHITTRNFFAFLLGKPLVGEHMGQAFVDLQERLRLFRPEADNDQDFLDYAEHQGYRDLVESTDYALAFLFYAEHYKQRAVWIDAFAHCVGMNASLALSPEYISNSRLTKALIIRAYVEVNIHLGRVSTALSKFLNEDLSSTYLGLTYAARSHLDRFRKFLHAFYVEKFGYWPPPQGAAFPKAMYKSMYYDFRNLYDYLADTDSTTNISLQKPASGGMCILQNVGNFDKRHNFPAQPHPLPLLPTYAPPSRKSDSQKALRQLTLALQHDKTHQIHNTNAALAVATNTLDKDVTGSKMVQAYMDFERVHALDASQREEKVSAVDARKVRWLLIYGTLQYLVSALRAPKEVRDAETPDYPLCCLVAGQDLGSSNIEVATPPANPAMTTPQALVDYLSSSQRSPCTVQPDCHREDYFTSRSTSRRGSMEAPAPLNISQSTRPSSIRSFGPLTLSTRSSRRNSLTLKPTQHCPILVHGYGDGLNETTVTPPCQAVSRRVSSVYSEQSAYSVLPDGAGPETSWLRPQTPQTPPTPHSRNLASRAGSTISRSRTSLLDSALVNQPADVARPDAADEAPSRSDSTGSTCSSVWSEGVSAVSSKSSAGGEHLVFSKAGPAEYSGLLGGLVPVSSNLIESSQSLSATTACIEQSHIHPLLRGPPEQDDYHLSSKNQGSGCNSAFPLSNTVDSTIGLALSAPPPPPTRPNHDLKITSAPIDSPSPMDENKPDIPPRLINIDSPPTWTSNPAQKGRSTDIFSALTPSSDIWEQYKAALGRRESGPTSASTHATPPSNTKPSYPFRMPSFKTSMKNGNIEEQGNKKEKRFSSLWRRG